MVRDSDGIFYTPPDLSLLLTFRVLFIYWIIFLRVSHKQTRYELDQYKNQVNFFIYRCDECTVFVVVCELESMVVVWDSLCSTVLVSWCRWRNHTGTSPSCTSFTLLTFPFTSFFCWRLFSVSPYLIYLYHASPLTVSSSTSLPRSSLIVRFIMFFLLLSSLTDLPSFVPPCLKSETRDRTQWCYSR